MKREHRAGFTLVELLIVIIIGAVLASIAIPKFTYGWKSGSESRLRENLKEYRNAVERFHTDTGLYPASLSDARKQSAPTTGLTSTGASRPIPAGTWNGPYLKFFSATSSIHPDIRTLTYSYQTEAPTVGKVNINSGNKDLSGVRYSAW